MSIATINPATGETLRTFEPLTPQELEARLQLAADTYRRYRRTPFADRKRMMLKAGDILDAEKDALGRVMVTEMGKTLKAAVGGGGQVRLGVSLLRRARRAVPARRDRGDRPRRGASSPISRSARCWR